jgi:hypothetical protein
MCQSYDDLQGPTCYFVLHGSSKHTPLLSNMRDVDVWFW